MQYSRTNPSPEFYRYLEMYAQMHLEGHQRSSADKQRTAKDTFPGEELTKIKGHVRDVAARTCARDMMDYGCGKAVFYDEIDPKDGTKIPDFIGIRKECIYLYEPGIPELSKFPEHSQFDLVISNDVIEHIPEPDVYWVLEELFALAKEAVVVRISCVEALAMLPDGTNAHCTIKSHEYWKGACTVLSNKYDVAYCLETTEHAPTGGYLVRTDTVYKERHC